MIHHSTASLLLSGMIQRSFDMVHIAFLPSESSRCCLDISKLLSSTLSPILDPSSHNVTVQTEVTPETTALIWLPNISQGGTSSELRSILFGTGSNIKFVQLPMTGVDHFVPLIRETSGRVRWCCAKVRPQPPASHFLCETLLTKKILFVLWGV